MSAAWTLILAAAIGVIAGLRTLTAPAAVCWGARLERLDLRGSHLAFLGSSPAVFITSALALCELIADKLPFIPNRTDPIALGGRILGGALSGAAICASGNQMVLPGVALGGLGAIAGAFAGFRVRRDLVRKRHFPDAVIALLEDALAVGGAFLIVFRS